MQRIVLIGEISSYKAIVICRFLKSYYDDVLILTYDTKKFTKKIVSRYSDKHFLVSTENFEGDLKGLIEDNNVDYFFPVINDSLYKLWKKKIDYADALSYLGDIESYEILNDKIKLHKLAKQLGLSVPVRYESIQSAKIPYVVKPTNLSSAEGVVYVQSESEIPKETQYDNLIIQQYVQGIGIGYSFYCKDGEILNAYGHKRLAEYPVSGGSSTYREGYNNNEMHEIASKIVGHLKYTGFAMFEYKLTAKNEIYLIEVNPRIWGSVNQGLSNGVNYFEGILGKAHKLVEKRVHERKTFLPPLFYVSLIKYAFRFEFQAVFYFIKNIGKNSADVCFFTDPKGFLSMMLRKIL